MRVSRRDYLLGSAAVAASVSLTLPGCGATADSERLTSAKPAAPQPQATDSGISMREFGRTGFRVSEVGFGAWAMGGEAYGQVAQQSSLDALARAEELGCNFVDTAMVYGVSELVLGKFLTGRRSRWVISTKYSGQAEGLQRTLETQLKRLGTDYIDFYMIHWAPSADEAPLYEELYRAKKSGKVRAVGISLKTAKDVDAALDTGVLDGFMVKFSLLDPDPFLACRARIQAKRPAVIIRSALREGFLTGKYGRNAQFPDPRDQRHSWTREQIEKTVDQVEKFRFLESGAGSMAAAAARYPLSFNEVSTVVLGTKNVVQAANNFGVVPGKRLSPADLESIRRVQLDLGLRSWRNRAGQFARELMSR